jgi:hypothetical protein
LTSVEGDLSIVGNIVTEHERVIRNHEQSISNLRNRTDVTENNVAINTTDISVNRNDISVNNSNITTNSTAINTNSTNISANRSDTNANRVDIDANRVDIDANSTDITTNRNAIVSNTRSIVRVDGASIARDNVIRNTASRNEMESIARDAQLAANISVNTQSISQLNYKVKEMGYSLSSGIAGALASTHAIRSTEGLRLGVGAYNGEQAVALGGRIKDKTFTFAIDSQKKVSFGFGLDL